MVTHRETSGCAPDNIRQKQYITALSAQSSLWYREFHSTQRLPYPMNLLHRIVMHRANAHHSYNSFTLATRLVLGGLAGYSRV